MIGFTLAWDPYGVGFGARKTADGGLLDGRVCAAVIEYAHQLAAQQQWDANVGFWWSYYPTIRDLARAFQEDGFDADATLRIG